MGLAYERIGSGPPLVLLHGIGHRRQAWNAITALLAPHRELILVDLPGHGESPPLRMAGRPPVQAMAEEISGFLDEQGLGRPHMAGNSLGGALALIAAAQGRAASVTGLSPAGFWQHDRQIRFTKANFKVMQAVGATIRPAAPLLTRSTAGRALMYATIVHRPSRLSPEQALADTRAFLAAQDVMNAILASPPSFTLSVPASVPVTIAWGTHDRLLPPSQARVAQQRLPQARYVPLPGCGHVPMTDDPALVARVLLDGSATPSADGRVEADGWAAIDGERTAADDRGSAHGERTAGSEPAAESGRA
jgi:pimeloyl-ACP methyl ester carboxylesterase